MKNMNKWIFVAGCRFFTASPPQQMEAAQVQKLRGEYLMRPLYLDAQATTPMDPRCDDYFLWLLTGRPGNYYVPGCTGNYPHGS